MKSFLALAALAASVSAGTTVWSGSFNSYNSASDFDTWTWSNEVGEYQWYIHGSQPTSHYLALDPSYKNPADTAETHGLKLTVDNTAYWNGDSSKERTELIPQGTTAIATGHLYYHFSLMTTSTNAPDPSHEHQILFFESHFVQLKYGVAPNPTYLQFFSGQNVPWSTPLTPGTWYNFAYDITFGGSTCGLWASTGSSPLTQVVSGSSCSPSSNGQDFHVGVLVLSSTSTEDWYISGVYIESGSITTAIGTGGGGTPPPPTSSTSSTTARTTTTTARTTATTTARTTTTTARTMTTTTTPHTTTTTSTAGGGGGTAAHWAQCGGIGYSGPTVCASPYTCQASNPYYSQCL